MSRRRRHDGPPSLSVAGPAHGRRGGRRAATTDHPVCRLLDQLMAAVVVIAPLVAVAGRPAVDQHRHV